MDKIKDFIGYKLFHAAKAHRQWADRELGKIGLHAGQEMILFQLWKQEGLTQSAIAEQMGVEHGTISIMLKRLESAGFITRKTDTEDARVTRVYLTGKGQQVEPAVCQIWQELEGRAMAQLSEAEQLLVKRLLDDIKTAFKG